MNKLSDYMAVYYEFSGKASDVARNLAFAGIALIWLFRIENEPTPRIPPQLLPPLTLLAMSLGLDLLQYISATCVWGIFQWHHERTLKDKSQDPQLAASTWLKLPQFGFFALKLISVLAAYALIVKYAWGPWF
jgi:hypothetical protein